MSSNKLADQTITKEKEDLRNYEDLEKYAHYVDQEQNNRRKAQGKPSIALCGKVWMARDNADGFPLCPKCKEVRDSIMNG